MNNTPPVTSREIWAWGLYDFANSAFATSILAVIFNRYFAEQLAGGADGVVLDLFSITLRVPGVTFFTYTLAAAMLVVALLAPVPSVAWVRSPIQPSRYFPVSGFMVGSVCAAYFPVVKGASVGDPVNTREVLRKDWYPAGRQNIFQRPPLPRTNKVPHRILDLQRRHSNNRCYLSNLHRRSPWDVGWHDPGAVSRHSSDSVCRRVNPGVGKSAEFFAFYGIAGRFSSVLGPLTYGSVYALLGARPAILCLAVFFIIGLLILLTVDEKEGQRQAKMAVA